MAKIKNKILYLVLSSILFLVFLLVTISIFFYTLSNTKYYELTTDSFKGRIYSITFPHTWKFEGPAEGPITGFPEYTKITSPSGDSQLYVGLRGDNRFEFSSDSIKINPQPFYLKVSGSSYYAEEYYLDLNKDGESDVAIIESEISESKFIGYREFSQEIYLPIKIQLLYGFSSENIPFEQKLIKYSSEKAEALKILSTFKLNN